MDSVLASGVVEVAIGLAFIYLLLSLICSVVNEWIAGVLNSRAKNLEAGIRSLFTDGEFKKDAEKVTTLADAIYGHGLVQSLYRTDRLDKILRRAGRPSYIPSRIFASALVDILIPADANGSKTIGDLRQAIANLPESKGRQALLTIVGQAGNDLTAARASIEAWYNDGMDRVAGWYKRKSSMVLLVLAIAVAVTTNTDSVLVARTLWTNPALRAATTAAADNFVTKNKTLPAGSTTAGSTAATPSTTTPPDSGGQPTSSDSSSGNQPQQTGQQLGQDIKDLNQQLQNLQLPVGWPSKDANAGAYNSVDPRSFPTDFQGWAFRILGWFFTAIALSLGAPFWFDLLNKFMVVRSTIKPREKSGEEASKDAKPSSK